MQRQNAVRDDSGDHLADIRIPSRFPRIVNVITLITMTVLVVSTAGDVAETRRDSSADDRFVPVRSGHADQRRLQPENDRVEPDHTGREAVRRGLLLLPDQHEARPRHVRHSTQRPQYVTVDY